MGSGFGFGLDAAVILLMRVTIRVTSRAAWITTLWLPSALALSAVMRARSRTRLSLVRQSWWCGDWEMMGCMWGLLFWVSDQ